jgi:hypothetical protein
VSSERVRRRRGGGGGIEEEEEELQTEMAVQIE